ncbi:MAG: UvrD-helicase domain-containing protein, partial [Candidatus Gracilibacteria bacterium]|nr:UvrD-helicase domain-containing protein [Candidatus Gracilibacteria bacterium]
MNKNKIIIASAGSGKTRTLVEEAILIAKKFPNKNVLITTFTEANEQSIKNKIIQKTGGYIPENIIVQTRFSFLLEHGVKPFQSELDDDLWGKNVGFCFVDKKSAQKFDETGKAITFISSEGKENPIYWGENENFNKHYFNSNFQIYSDKISKFVIRCDKKTKEEKKDIGIIIERISKIFSHIFIDEVQDLARYDLEILKLLFKSESNILLVGDPRQGTY